MTDTSNAIASALGGSTTTSTPTSTTGGSGITFTGLESNIDTNAIVEQLMTIEKQPQVLLQQQQLIVKARQQALMDINSKLVTLKGAADDLRSFTLWAGSPYAAATDPGLLGATATANAAAGTYNVVINQLAHANVMQTHAVAASDQFGSAYAGAGVYAGSSSLLTSLTDQSGSSLGYAVGSTINVSATQNGHAVSGSYTVTATSTVNDLRSFVQTTLPGATVSLQPGGKMQVDSPPGIEQAFTGISVGGLGTATETTAAQGHTTIQASGTLHLASGGVPIDVAVTAGESMSDVANAINGKNGTVTASVANGLLRLQSSAAGTANAIQISYNNGAQDLGLDTLVTAQDATGSVDGTAFTSSTNAVANAIGGVTLNLTGTTAATGTTLTVDPARLDKDAIKTKIGAFVTAYNDVITTVSSKINETTVLNPSTNDDIVKGALFGDSTLTNVLDQIREAMQSPVAGATAGQNIMSFAGLSTGAIGSTFSPDLVSGKLTLDENQLDKALGGGGDALKTLFMSNGGASASDGLMQRISDLSFGYTSTNGAITAEVSGETAESADLQARIDDWTQLLSDRETTLKAQFTAMEAALSQLHQMQAGLNGSSTASSSSG